MQCFEAADSLVVWFVGCSVRLILGWLSVVRLLWVGIYAGAGVILDLGLKKLVGRLPGCVGLGSEQCRKYSGNSLTLRCYFIKPSSN